MRIFAQTWEKDASMRYVRNVLLQNYLMKDKHQEEEEGPRFLLHYNTYS